MVFKMWIVYLCEKMKSRNFAELNNLEETNFILKITIYE